MAVLTGNVTGTVYITQEKAKGPVFITGTLKGLTPQAQRGFHVQCAPLLPARSRHIFDKPSKSVRRPDGRMQVGW